MEKKLITPPEILCKKMPVEFSYYFHYCRNLKFEDRPDFNMLKNLFLELLSSRVNLKEEIVFDWFDEDNAYKEKKKLELNLFESGRIVDFKEDKKGKSDIDLINIKEESKEESNINNDVQNNKLVNKNDDNKNLIEEQNKEEEEKKDSEKNGGQLEEKSSESFKVVDKND